MKNAPRVHDVGGTQRGDEGRIQNRSLFNGPLTIVGGVTAPQLGRARDRRGIEVERSHTRAKPASGKAEQPTATADVEKTTTRQIAHAQQLAHRTLGLANTIII